MAAYKIETAVEADYIEIVDVWETSVRATHHFLRETDIQYFKPLILTDYLKAVNLFCVRNTDTEIIAFLGLSDEAIEMLFLRPDVFRQGLGSHLVRFAIDQHQINKVDVNEDNPQAVDFYKQMGFNVISRSELDPLGKPYPILHMGL
ncbi:MAG: GNAT family N-acetyltransferase [Calditrichaeota bacterium]|nr:GNAT family N-acetyltransferase [Calditrichota bacterium]